MHDLSAASTSPVLVLGLDGATWDIAQPLIQAGRMPTLARLVAQGTSGALDSTVPPVSAAAWITFLTGQNPGRHGVYQFRKMDMRQYGGYRDEFATSRDFAGRSFIELAGQRGRRVAAIGVPMTYPPFPVNGVLVSGFPRPFGPRAHTYPPAFADTLGRWDEAQDSFNFSLSPAKTIETSDYWVRRYTDIAAEILADQSPDLTLVVWNNTDTIPHLYWKFCDPAFPAYDLDGAATFSEVINHQYELADGQIGRLVAALSNPEAATVLVMSDHGMGAHPHRRVGIGVWLAEHGYLAPKKGAAGGPNLVGQAVVQVRRRLPRQWLDRVRSRVPAGLRSDLYARQQNLDRIDWSATSAYRVKVFPSVEGIALNVRGRQPQGIVEPGQEYETLRDRLLGELEGLVDPESGQPIIARASRREELFEGPYVDDIPDILLELHPIYTGGANVRGSLVTDLPLDELSAYSGAHRPEGLFVFCGPHIRRGHRIDGANIQDLGPTLLHVMGLPVASWMDGKVLLDVFEPTAAWPVSYAEYDAPTLSHRGEGLSVEDETAIRTQLAGLGYL